MSLRHANPAKARLRDMILIAACFMGLTTGVASATQVSGGGSYSGTPTVAFVGGIGTGATATVTQVGGVITGATVTNPGGGYTTAPTVAITGSGSGCTATVQIDAQGHVLSITITAGGTGYSSPVATFTSATPASPATGTAVVTANAVASITITAAGSGYTAVPTITFSGGGGTGASFTAVLAAPANGALTAVNQADGQIGVINGGMTLTRTGVGLYTLTWNAGTLPNALIPTIGFVSPQANAWTVKRLAQILNLGATPAVLGGTATVLLQFLSGGSLADPMASERLDIEWWAFNTGHP